jgi:hypothetical protein
MLLYSLLQTNVEAISFENAVKRMIGMTKRGVMSVLTLQALAYGIIPLILGLSVSQLLLNSVAQIVVSIDVDFKLPYSSILLAGSLAILIPILSSIIPIRFALKRNIREGIDLRRSSFEAVEITKERNDTSNQKTSLFTLLVGAACAIFGFMIYYLVPLSLLSLNLTLFSDVFFFIILGSFFGLVIIALNLSLIFQSSIAFLFPSFIGNLVQKNLKAHQNRNSKTSLMITASIGFIMFLQSAYQMEVSIENYKSLQDHGAEYVLTADTSFTLMFQDDVEEFLQEVNSSIYSYSWITKEATATILNVGQVFEDSVSIYGVSEGFYASSFNDFFKISEERHLENSKTITENLYQSGSNFILIKLEYSSCDSDE